VCVNRLANKNNTNEHHKHHPPSITASSFPHHPFQPFPFSIQKKIRAKRVQYTLPVKRAKKILPAN
jgi:hypothetical protein